eukprot:334115-Rhodomonas_salina.2
MVEATWQPLLAAMQTTMSVLSQPALLEQVSPQRWTPRSAIVLFLLDSSPRRIAMRLLGATLLSLCWSI